MAFVESIGFIVSIESAKRLKQLKEFKEPNKLK
jgi:hypothetical protein